MLRALRILSFSVATCALATVLCGSSVAGTIIRLGLGSDPSPDIEYDANSLTLSTYDDGDGATTEDQDTNVDFQGFIAAHIADIPTATASISLNGLIAAPPVTVVLNTLVIQNFNGGAFILRDASNTELLSGTLGASSLAGTLGGPGAGALFTTTFSSGNPTGTLAPYIKPNSLTLSMSFTDVMSNGASGFALQAADPTKLASFTGDVTINISAEAPEPVTAMLLLIAVFTGFAALRTKR
jgi:hypothetical protein